VVSAAVHDASIPSSQWVRLSGRFLEPTCALAGRPPLRPTTSGRILEGGPARDRAQGGGMSTSTGDASQVVAATLDELTGRLTAVAREIVPWFLEQMPASYFEDVDPQSRLEHMGAILALRAAGQEPRLRIKSADGRRVTYMLPDDAPGTLTRLMRDFSDGTIRAAKIYSSRDKQLIIDTFDIGRSPPCNLDVADLREKYLATLALAERRQDAQGGPVWLAPDVVHHFAGLTEDYVRACTPERILGHAELCRDVRRRTTTVIQLDDSQPDRSRLVIACSNVSSTSIFMRFANRLSTLSIDVTRAYVETMCADAEEPVVIISAVVAGPDGRPIDPASPLWQRLRDDLARVEWLDAETLELGRVTIPEKQHEYYCTIRKESERLTALINNILDFSRIEAGRKEYDFRSTNLPELVRTTLESYRYQIEQQGFKFEEHIAEDIPPVVIDREAIARSLLNLVNNAIKYSSSDRYLAVNLRRSNGSVKLEVVDHGIGIAREEQPKIFEKFYRVCDPLVHNTKGSGLGLCLVKHIAHAHGGDVSVESTLGKGSKFSLVLPVEPPVAAMRNSNSKPDVSQGVGVA